jgi:hypothetical protein
MPKKQGGRSAGATPTMSCSTHRAPAHRVRFRESAACTAIGVVVVVVSIASAQDDGTPPAATACPFESQAFHRCALERAASFDPPRTSDGRPDLQGLWTIRHNGSVWNIEPSPGDAIQPATSGVIVDPSDRLVPYQPWALARRDELTRLKFEDPRAHCAMSGTPRASFSNYGLRIAQPPNHVVILYESVHEYRVIPTDGRAHLPEHIKLWGADPIGRWEGNTLVVDYANINGKLWYDQSGNFQSESTRVVERYTLVDPDTIHFEATIEDPMLYTQPWKVAVAFTRNSEEGYYLLEYACHEGERDLQHYSEELGKGQSEVFIEPGQRAP